MDKLTLYIDRFWISPYAFSAWVALEEKGLAFETIELGLDRKDHQAPDYQSGSITGRVPALRHGDFWLAESSAIVEYVDEIARDPSHLALLPTNLRDRARCRQVMAWIRSDLMPIREERATHTMFYVRASKPLSPVAEQAKQRLVFAADKLVPADRTTLFEQWSIADADLGFMLARLHINGDSLPAKLVTYCETQLARPSVKKWFERERPPYVGY